MILTELEKPTFEGEVLLCEDNSMNQKVICEHLKKVGLKTVVAENGKVGVDMVQSRMQKGEKQFDLIFMDMHMPVMDGLEATEKILELKTGVPIVAMTANIMSHDRELYKESGMDGYVGKPFTSQELWRCLMKYFTPINGQEEDKTKSEQADEKLQQDLINVFVNSNRDKHKEIVNAIITGDIKLAHRLAHTIKSNAAQLGKTALQKAADDIENALVDEINNVTRQELDIFGKELAAVIAELESLI
jgi:CheY-like chemotaxis protein